MKTLFAIALLIFTTACAQTETTSMGAGKMCGTCPCCQKMMEGGMKSGMQCPITKDGKKAGMKCGGCDR